MLGLKIRAIRTKTAIWYVIKVLKRSIVVVSTRPLFRSSVGIKLSSVDIWPFLSYLLGSQLLEVWKFSKGYKGY